MLEYFISAEIFIKKINKFDENTKKKALYLAINKTKENHFDSLKFILLLNNLKIKENTEDLENKLNNFWINLTSVERINLQPYLRLVLNKFLEKN